MNDFQNNLFSGGETPVSGRSFSDDGELALLVAQWTQSKTKPPIDEFLSFISRADRSLCHELLTRTRWIDAGLVDSIYHHSRNKYLIESSAINPHLLRKTASVFAQGSFAIGKIISAIALLFYSVPAGRDRGIASRASGFCAQTSLGQASSIRRSGAS